MALEILTQKNFDKLFPQNTLNKRNIVLCIGINDEIVNNIRQFEINNHKYLFLLVDFSDITTISNIISYLHLNPSSPPNYRFYILKGLEIVYSESSPRLNEEVETLKNILDKLK